MQPVIHILTLSWKMAEKRKLFAEEETIKRCRHWQSLRPRVYRVLHSNNARISRKQMTSWQRDLNWSLQVLAEVFEAADTVFTMLPEPRDRWYLHPQDRGCFDVGDGLQCPGCKKDGCFMLLEGPRPEDIELPADFSGGYWQCLDCGYPN